MKRLSLVFVAVAGFGLSGCEQLLDWMYGGSSYGCEENWSPVCGQDGSTYGNECEADWSGVDIAHEGECEPEDCQYGWEHADRNGSCGPYTEPWNDCGCPAYWSPVCEADGTLYPNRCEARCAGATEVGSCDGAGGSGGEPCGCTDEWDPVCGEDGNTYTSEGCAACEEVEVAYEGECAPPTRGR